MGIDPLTQHIFERINPDGSSRPRPNQFAGPQSPGAEDAEPRISMDPGVADREFGTPPTKDKKLRVSFLSRFKPSKRRDSATEFGGDVQEGTENRAEGADAAVFSQPIGYIPRFLEPPKYIKVRSRGKKERDFNRVFLAQELRGRTGVEIAQAGGRKINPEQKNKQGNAIWALEFSKDGLYLAAGGHDHIVRVWGVIASATDRQEEEKNTSDKEGRMAAPVFKSRPIQEYEGHASTILALNWSKVRPSTMLVGEYLAGSLANGVISELNIRR